MSAYRGRFAPSPTGPLHVGSVVAALASWLDARAHGGRWLVRIEDIDTPRCPTEMDQLILQQLSQLGLFADEPVTWQSRRTPLYAQALSDLRARGLTYPCTCSRSDIARALRQSDPPRERHHMLVYPGTCRPERGGPVSRPWREPADRLKIVDPHTGLDLTAPIHWHDRRHGPQSQNLMRTVGDFVLRRADHQWAYQLAVVVDDAAQGITHIVRGDDLADNTARQIHLQQCLGLPRPRYLHTPLVLDAHGEKLSKQTDAQAVNLENPLQALKTAGAVLGVRCETDILSHWLAAATRRWAELYAR